ncbi:MAG TPA: SDR family oxidoreductase [Chloroflexota bacterium]|nr:SDR family oxidoreductase [Chloroflexota bacterium]
MQRTLTDKVAIVTGASSGIGAATARELSRRGARVVLAARRVEQLEAQAHAITEAGGWAIAIPADVADAAQVTRLVERTRETFGQVDVLVNNAGISWSKSVVGSAPDEITRMLEVNLLGAMLLTRAVLPEMLERGNGAIISVSSVGGRVAVEPLYSATKYGLRGFSLALRRQIAGSGVSVSLVLPGNIRTPVTSGIREKMPGPELVANTIASLITHPRREVVIPRKHHAVVWLEQLLPGVADVAYHTRHRLRPDLGKADLAYQRHHGVSADSSGQGRVREPMEAPAPGHEM